MCVLDLPGKVGFTRLVNIYASNHTSERTLLQNQIAQSCATHTEVDHWILGGDWNVVETLGERYINTLNETLCPSLSTLELEAWPHLTIPLGLIDASWKLRIQGALHGQINRNQCIKLEPDQTGSIFPQAYIAHWIYQVTHHSLLGNLIILRYM